MEKIKAKNRFDQVEIYPQRTNRFFADQPPIHEDIPHDRLFYSCPKSDLKVEFKDHDFKAVTKSARTNLSENDARNFNDAAEKFGLTAQKHLDFYCPGCKSPVRVYFEPKSGGRHGDFFCRVTWVLET